MRIFADFLHQFFLLQLLQIPLCFLYMHLFYKQHRLIKFVFFILATSLGASWFLPLGSLALTLGLPVAMTYIVVRSCIPDSRKGPAVLALLVMSCALSDYIKRHIWGTKTSELVVSLKIGMGLVVRLSQYAFDVYTEKKSRAGIEKCGKTPPANFFELLSFALFPVGIILGPHLNIQQFRSFVSSSTPPKIEDQIAAKRIDRIKHLTIVLITTSSFLLVAGPVLFPTSFISSREYVEMNTFLRLIYEHFYVFNIRCDKYYGWSINEISLLILGLGYNPNTKEWDALRNFDIIGFEFTNGIKDRLSLWNMGAAKWLRQCIYLPWMDMTNGNRMFSALVTFTVSGIWHGARPGVFLCSITLLLFDATLPMIPFQCLVNYAGVPFSLPTFLDVWNYWKGHYFYGHLVIIAVFTLLPIYDSCIRARKENSVNKDKVVALK